MALGNFDFAASHLPGRAQGQPVPAPSPAAPAPAPAGRQAPPAGMRYNAAGQVVPIRNPVGPAQAPAPSPAPAAGPTGGGIPLWLQRANPGATPQQLQAQYQNFLGRNPAAPGNAGGVHSPATTGPFVPAPAPTGGPVGSPPGGQQPGPGQPPGGFNPGDFNDPFNMFLAAVPGMNLNMNKQIADAMGTAGFSGNRYGTSAMNTAGQIGAQNALAQNELLQKTLYDYANNEQNRALQADQLGIQSAGLQNQIDQSKLTLPFSMAQYEQGRQDNFSNMAYQDWNQNKLGWFPYMLQAATSQGAGTPGQIYQTQTAAQPGAADLLGLLGNLFGGGG